MSLAQIRLIPLFIVLLCLSFVSKSQTTKVNFTQAAGRYRFLGCYKDEQPKRVLPINYFNARKFLDWKMPPGWNKTVIEACAAKARESSDLTLFGVQHWGECWGATQGIRYDRLGGSQKCMSGLGMDWTNAVYELISECEVNGVVYKDGQPFFLPQNPVDYSDVGCKSCTCDRGLRNCRFEIKCDFFSPCDKFIPAPQGKCCPTCACEHQGIKYKDGDTWINRNESCFDCTCVKGQSNCLMASCEKSCPNPVYEPGKCCPKCYPGAPIATEQPTFIIKETTPRPPPMFPPFPGFGGNQKRVLKDKNNDKRGKQ